MKKVFKKLAINGSSLCPSPRPLINKVPFIFSLEVIDWSERICGHANAIRCVAQKKESSPHNPSTIFAFESLKNLDNFFGGICEIG